MPPLPLDFFTDRWNIKVEGFHKNSRSGVRLRVCTIVMLNYSQTYRSVETAAVLERLPRTDVIPFIYLARPLSNNPPDYVLTCGRESFSARNTQLLHKTQRKSENFWLADSMPLPSPAQRNNTGKNIWNNSSQTKCVQTLFIWSGKLSREYMSGWMKGNHPVWPVSTANKLKSDQIWIRT